MLDIISLYFLLFIVYSFLGWCMEMVFCYFCTNKWINRGFLIGPVCPIYGFGSLGIIILLQKYYNDPIVSFVMVALICSMLEYFTSYIMEKLFAARWWDYSDKKYNINGRICLEIIVLFGLAGLLIMYVVNPSIMGVISRVDSSIINIISLIMLIIFIVDNCVSLKVISSFKNVASSINKDSTEEITKKIKEKLIRRGGLYKRLVMAFNFKVSEKLLEVRNRIKKTASGAKKKIELENKKIKEKIKKTK